MTLPGWGLRCSLLHAAFPFHLVLGRDLRLRQVGDSLHQLWPGLVPGCDLRQVVEIVAPSVALTFEALRAEPRSVFLLQARGTSGSVRGQMLYDNDADV